jgi:Leucine-rich repeat (LRR) protein
MSKTDLVALRTTLSAALAQVDRLAGDSGTSETKANSNEIVTSAPAWLTRVDLSGHGAAFVMTEASLRGILEHATHLSLRHNALTALSSVAGALVRPATLVALDVSHNALVSLEAANLMPNLKSLRANHNPALASLASLAHPRLEQLHVAHCAIAGALSPAFCASCTALRALDVSFNALDSLPAAALHSLALLEVLDLRSNRLVELPSSLELCTALVSLNLANNHLRSLPRVLGAFAELHRRGVRVLLAELPFLQSLVVDGNPLPIVAATTTTTTTTNSATVTFADRTATDVASLLRANSPDPNSADAVVAAVVAAAATVGEPSPSSLTSSAVIAPLPTKSASLTDATKRKVELDPRSAFLPSLDFEVEPFSTIYSEPSKPIIEELSTDTYDYIQFYFGKDHYNFYGIDGKIGPVVVSIRKDLESAVAICGDVDTTPVPPGGIGYYRALVRTKKGVERFFIPNTLVDPSLIEDAVPAAGTASATNAATSNNTNTNSGIASSQNANLGSSNTATGHSSSSNNSASGANNAGSSQSLGEPLSKSKSGKNVLSLAKQSDSAETASGGGGLLRGKKLRGAMLTRALQDLASPLLNDTTLIKVSKSDMLKRLVEYENSLIMSGYKFGVVYAAPGQTTEAEILSNTKGSPAFDEFLAFLGNRVALKGFKKYAGGLDTKSGSTGENAVYTKYAGLEFLFHVSTMLPYKEGDEQQLERKRHIGNDVVVIVFQDGDTPLKPDFIRSVFNHIIVIVRPVKLTEQQLAAAASRSRQRWPIISTSRRRTTRSSTPRSSTPRRARAARGDSRAPRDLGTELRTTATEESHSPDGSPTATPRGEGAAAAAADTSLRRRLRQRRRRRRRLRPTARRWPPRARVRRRSARNTRFARVSRTAKCTTSCM